MISSNDVRIILCKKPWSEKEKNTVADLILRVGISGSIQTW